MDMCKDCDEYDNQQVLLFDDETGDMVIVCPHIPFEKNRYFKMVPIETNEEFQGLFQPNQSVSTEEYETMFQHQEPNQS